MTTPNGAPEWAGGQSSPDVTMNEAVRRTEAGGNQYVVVDKDLTAPPGSCADGATYIVAGSPTGLWSGHAKDLAIAVGVNAASGWYFRTPVEGVQAYLQDENLLYSYSGSAWSAGGAGTGDMLAANNLSDVASAATSRTNLGLAIGTNVQAYSANLTTLAGVSPTTVGTNFLGVTNPSAITFLRVNADNSVTLLNAAAFRTAIGAGTGSGSGDVVAANNGSDFANIATVRVNLKFDRVSTNASSSSPMAWNSDSYNQINLTALANALTINADSGTPIDGQKIIFRLKDNATARALTWTTGSSKAFRAVGVTLPTTTVLSKTVYVGCIYNADADRWDAIAVAQEA